MIEGFIKFKVSNNVKMSERGIKIKKRIIIMMRSKINNFFL